MSVKGSKNLICKSSFFSGPSIFENCIKNIYWEKIVFAFFKVENTWQYKIKIKVKWPRPTFHSAPDEPANYQLSMCMYIHCRCTLT